MGRRRPRGAEARGQGLTPAEIGWLLKSCIAEHDWNVPAVAAASNVAGRSLTAFVAAATYHRVAPMAYLTLRGVPGLDASALAMLEAGYRDAVTAHLRASADLRGLGASLDRAGIASVVFKGPVLSETVYARPDLRPYRDLDVLVAARDFGDAVACLETDGFHLLDRNWDLIRAERRGQLHFVLRLGTVTDLHWHVLNRPAGRSTLAISGEDLIERSSRALVAGVATRILDPVDSLLHLCVHAALAGGDRLLWLKDIERTIGVCDPDWDVVLERARVWKASVLVGAMLSRATAAAGAHVPDDVVAGLLPGAWRRALFTVDRRWPPERSNAATNPAAQVFRVLRGGAPGSVAAALGRVRDRSRLRAFRRRLPASDPALAVLHDAGGADARAAYLRDVHKFYDDARGVITPS